jgi:hypothetical protein
MTMASNSDRLTRSPRSIREGNKDPYHDSSKVQLGMSDEGDDFNAGARSVEDEKISKGPSGYPIRGA